MSRQRIHDQLDEVVESLVAIGYSYQRVENLILSAFDIMIRKGAQAKETNATLRMSYTLIPQRRIED